jgi:aminopeptidase
MQPSTISRNKVDRQFPPFDLVRLLRTVFSPKKGEKLCILIDLDKPNDIVDFEFLNNQKLPVQKKAYDVFYKALHEGAMQELGLSAVDFFAYKTTGGSNLELPDSVTAPDGNIFDLQRNIYSFYDIILCITSFSATAPLTAASKKFSFRGATMHGMNDIILNSGLAVDYNEVSKEAEKLRLGMTHADSVDIDFEVEHRQYHLSIDLGRQDAQKSHGLCRKAPDVANLPAGEVYFVPRNAKGSFPIKFDDGTIGLMHVEDCKVKKIDLIKGIQETVDLIQHKLITDPATGILGELGFGTQVLPFANSDIQDEKIFGTFHVATGRNDHLKGNVTLDRFANPKNATHDDILFSPTKTPEIHIKKVVMKRKGKTEVLMENYEPSAYLLSLLKK